MRPRTLVLLLVVLSLLGIGDSLYLAESAMTDTALVCDIGGGLDGCNTVAQSPYSQFFGLPLAYYGVGFYTLLLLISGLAFFKVHPRVPVVLFALTLVGAAASAYFLAIQFVIIKAICIYCVLSAVFAFIALAAATLLRRQVRSAVEVVP